MHPTIWGAARKFWLYGHFRLDVQSAAETLTSQLRTRTGLANMDATNVYEKVFNARSPVLAWPGDPSDRMVSCPTAPGPCPSPSAWHRSPARRLYWSRWRRRDQAVARHCQRPDRVRQEPPPT
ncbi:MULTISPECIES: TIGR02391 family protein [unclassified Streptomyces]|uniref:TIGR02391 family protein n=1 Tax=unclassified Streptomyces TaxID=2593676 RepID=UPI002DDAE7B7|nr:TIGR02391 family protein [Streptomyces sp. NBC_00243]WRZ25551.1 TIGR02391 family protein [Streptomyces sp. NBC_00243]